MTRYLFPVFGVLVTLFSVVAVLSDPTWGQARTSPGAHDPDESRIVFQSTRDGNWEIYVMKETGEEQTRLSDNPAIDWQAAWSPDGTRIAFTSYRDGQSDVYVMNTDGTGLGRVTTSGGQQPDWSPDGTKLVYVAMTSSQYTHQIAIINSDGTGFTPLTYGFGPSWSPDGSKIVFVGLRNDWCYGIYVMNSDGSGETRITNDYVYCDWDPCWSPDGTRIAFARDVSGNNPQIFVIDSDGSGLVRLTNNGWWDASPSFSPDGARIVFTRNMWSREAIVVMNADGSDQVELTPGTSWSDAEPDWWPGLPSMMTVAFDIKPGSCPNPLNMVPFENARGKAGAKTGGVLPVAILGSATFDVSEIDVSTVRLEGVEPLRHNCEDVATPVADSEECECTNVGPDGYLDLTLKFQKSQVVDALGAVSKGDVVPLTVTGQLEDGTAFEGTDCVTIVGGELKGREFSGGDILLDPAVPNPFNPTTTISFTLPERARVTLSIYDVQGRLVRTLVDETVGEGYQERIWDGKDASGSAVGSGVYFYRLTAGDKTLTKKMILLK